MDASDITLLVAPRDHFGHARDSLESLRATVPDGVHWVYVDAGSPRRLARWLADRARTDARFTLLRHDGFLTPNQARNRGLAHCRTPWVVFVDNDVFARPGWLEAMMACAEETGADVVSPVICIGGALHRDVHLAGGFARIEEEDGKRRFVERHGFAGERLADVLPKLERAPVSIVEFHCALARRETVARVEPLDERLLATREHLDFGLELQREGASLWFEPGAVITYLSPPPFARGDRTRFLLRWSDKLCRESTAWFYEKWRLDRDAKYRKWNGIYLKRRRRRALQPWAGWAVRLLGKRRAKRLLNRVERRWVRRPLARWRRETGALPPRA